MVNDIRKADLLLVNGKVITVDSRFSIQQATTPTPMLCVLVEPGHPSASI
jgi:Ni,Fe-hydrogenase III small subunit